MTAVSLGVFMSKPEENPAVLTFNKPKVEINMAVFDLDAFKNLKPLEQIQNQYNYSARTKSGRRIPGFMVAASAGEAKEILEAQNLIVDMIDELDVGRDEPFIPYYNVVPEKK